MASIRLASAVTMLLSLPVGALGGTYGAGIENSQWYHSGSIFGCTLTHDVPGYGRAVFQHRAGESLTFYLERQSRLMRAGQGELTIEAPAWRPGVASRSLGVVSVGTDRRPVTVRPQQAFVMVQSLLEGMAPTITRRAVYGDDRIRVRVSNINFQSSWQDYQDCVTSLLPVNYDQIQRSRIVFRQGGFELTDEHKERLNLIADFIEADATVETVYVDGHTDQYGSRIDNRALSEDRANVVTNYLIDQGVPEDMIVSRFHGEQFQAYSDPAENRRTTVRLEREGDNADHQRAKSNGLNRSNG